jgi:amino acid transporter
MAIEVGAIPRAAGEPGEKGLKGGALGLISGIVIGVASTAPAYSLAVSLGLVAAVVGILSPAIMLVSFVPMLCIAVGYYYMNRADPDCGTSFSWVTKAMGPWLGWITGWAIIVADIIVMASLAEIASIYTFRLFGIDTTTFGMVAVAGTEVDLGAVAIVALGVLFIALMTWICFIGIEVSVRTQVVLLGTELFALAVFSVVALWRVLTQTVDGSIVPSLDWLNPFAIASPSALAAGMLIALFIYWGWDTTATVNEETKDSTEIPGRASVIATVMLVATYLIVTIAAQAFHGPDFLAAQGEEDIFGVLAKDVLGSPLDLLLIIAVLTSAAASTQTTILPTARTALSMGAKRALPAYWAKIHPRYLTPSAATIWMGILSAAWYVGLKIVSENVFYDAIAALGLMIAFYYGLTGYACAIYYRHQLLRSAKHLVLVGIVPVIGGLILTWAFVQSVIDLADPANSASGTDWFGFGPPLVIAAAFGVLGLALMLAESRYRPEFFRRRPEVAETEVTTRGQGTPQVGPAH